MNTEEMKQKIKCALSSGMHMGELLESEKDMKAALVLLNKERKSSRFKDAVKKGIKQLEVADKKWTDYKKQNPNFDEAEDDAMRLRANFIPKLRAESKRA